ncbi:MAG: hypothetical protein ACXV3D_07160 [Halobacteriota archaeon]
MHWPLIIALVGVGLGLPFLTLLYRSKLRDQRLERTWGGKPGPEDAPSDINPLMMPTSYGSNNAGAYQRMLGGDRPPRY